jgi:redox-sensitive bicupin YhaK (pirin superfamily)
MRVTAGRVVAGRIEVPGETFVEGEAVTVLAPEGDETFTLTSEDEAALLAAMAEGDRGDVVSAEEFFRHRERGD